MPKWNKKIICFCRWWVPNKKWSPQEFPKDLFSKGSLASNVCWSKLSITFYLGSTNLMFTDNICFAFKVMDSFMLPNLAIMAVIVPSILHLLPLDLNIPLNLGLLGTCLSLFECDNEVWGLSFMGLISSHGYSFSKWFVSWAKKLSLSLSKTLFLDFSNEGLFTTNLMARSKQSSSSFLEKSKQYLMV